MKHGLNTDENTDAFVQVDLLMVIVIIGILAALSLAGLSQAKKKAQRIQCVNNVRQLGVGLQAFVAENNTYPLRSNPAFRQGGYPEHNVNWVIALQYNELSSRSDGADKKSFLKWFGQGVWKCPSAARPADWPPNDGYDDYGYNAYGMGARTDTNSLGLGGHYIRSIAGGTAPPVNGSEIFSPAEMMAIGDGFIGGNGVIVDGVGELIRSYSFQDKVGSTKRSYARHQGKANVVFCDGHVESPTLAILFTATNDAALVRWNRDHLPHREMLAP